MKSWAIHYKNKYPGAHVQVTEGAIDVYSGDGEHLIAIRKNGFGQWSDESEAFGCPERHDLSPIPRDARIYKEKDGKIVFDELHEKRREKRQKFLDDGKILSIAELSKLGHRFDDKGDHVSGPEEK